MCLGGSGGLFAAAILFAVRALLATEAPPPFGNAVSPGREPELDLRLGQPGVQVEDPKGLSPAERQLRERLNKDGHDNISLDDVQAIFRGYDTAKDVWNMLTSQYAGSDGA
ncbi:hypothetical protein FCV25MIE_24579 [Fagus crenata]